MSTEIRDLSSETVRDIIGLSNYTSNELTRQITDLSNSNTQLNTKQDTLTNGDVTNNLLANSSLSLGGVNVSLGGSDATPAFDLTDAINYPSSSLTGTIDLTSQVNGVLPTANGGSFTSSSHGIEASYRVGIGTNANNIARL